MIEYLPLVLTGIGIIVSILYYAMVLRNTQKARQIEMLQRLHETKYDVEGLQQYFTLMAWKWEDFDDYMQRLGGRNNPETSSIMESQMSYLDGLGVARSFLASFLIKLCFL